MKKGTLILCLAIFVTLCSGMDKAYAVAISNFEITGFYTTSDHVVDESDTYIKNVVVTYVDNLLAWGDSLFPTDTTPSAPDAAQLYVLGNKYIVIERDRWEWMKNYRVWEANRTVFLYPEDWLEPEVRDDRSPFIVLGIRPEIIPELNDARVEFFGNLRNTWYADLSGGPVSAPVPEPSTMLLFCVGLAGLGIMRKRFKV